MKGAIQNQLADSTRDTGVDAALKEKFTKLEEGLVIWAKVEEESHALSLSLSSAAKLPEDKCKTLVDQAVAVVSKLEALTKGARGEKEATIKLFKELGVK